MGAYLCKDAEHAKQAKKEDNENAMLPASEKVKNQDNNEAADVENPDIPFADAVVDEEETNDKIKNNETGKVVNDYNRSSVENQEFHKENKNTDTLNAEITVDIIKNVESEPYHHTESKEDFIEKSDIHNESELITPTEPHDEEMQPLIKEHTCETEVVVKTHVESENIAINNFELDLQDATENKSENVSLENNGGLNQECVDVLESEKIEVHDLESEQTKEHDTESEQSKEHDIVSEQTKEHDTESEETKEHDTEFEQNKEHEIVSEETKEHDTEFEQNKEHDIVSEETKEHDTESEQIKEHDTELEQPKEHDNESEQSIEHDIVPEETKEHDIESTKEHEIETNQIEENSNESEKIVTDSFADLEQENVEGHNKETESEISEVSNDFDTHKIIETESNDFPVETENIEENEAIESNSEIKDDSISNADEIILEPESLESEKESSPEIHEQNDNHETLDSSTNVSEINDKINVEEQIELEEHIKEHEEKYDEKGTLEEFTHSEDNKEAIENSSLDINNKVEEIIIEKQENEVPEISEKESIVSIENEKESTEISNEIDGEEDKHNEELSSDVAEKELVEVHEVENENIEKESNDEKVNITDDVLEENKSDLIIKDESQPSEELLEEITELKSSAEHTEPIENSEVTEEKIMDNLNDNSLVDIDLSTQHISSNGNATPDTHESDDQSISNEIEIENGVEDVKEEELTKMVSDAVDGIMEDAKSQVQHIVETPVSKDNSIDALEN